MSETPHAYTVLPSRRRLVALWRRWYAEEQGAVSTFILLMLPLFLLVLFGLNAVWQVAMVKQALRAGVYQSARFLSAEPQRPDDGVWRLAARRLIEDELAETPAFRLNTMSRATPETRPDFNLVYVDVNPVPKRSNCREPGQVLPFTVSAEVSVGVNLLPGLPGGGGLSVGVNLRDSADGEAICPND